MENWRNEDNELQLRRFLTYRNLTGSLVTATGKGIYTVNTVGVVICMAERIQALIPWHRVVEFTYDAQDADMRDKMTKL